VPSSITATSCRLTVLARSTRVDLVVPIDVPVADLLATLVAGLGPAMADEGIASGGWILQRVGDQPLDPARTLSMQNVNDGAVLHLLPRAQKLPEVAYDDVLDAVGTGVREGTARWNVALSRRMYVLLGSVALVLALVTCLLSGPSWTLPSIVLGVTAVLMILGGVTFEHALDSGRPAVLAGAAAIVFAAACGATALGKGRIWHFGAVQALPAACAAVFAAAVALVFIGKGVPLFVGVIGAGVLAGIGTGAADLSEVSPHGSAALTAIVALAFSPFLPVLSFRLSRLALPNIPTDAEDLRRDTATIDGRAVLGQAARADEYLTGLLGAISAAVAGCSIVLCIGEDVSARVLVAVLGLICLLRARLFTGLGQRASLLGAGTISLTSLLIAVALRQSHSSRVVVFVVPVLVLAILLLCASAVLPTRRLAPTWGRAADLLESTLVLSVIPLAVGVLGVYGAVRGLSSNK
jgi:type VII secretion integral membrane protein EccD